MRLRVWNTFMDEHIYLVCRRKEFALGDDIGDRHEVYVYGVHIDVRHDNGGAFDVLGADGAEQISPMVPPVAPGRRLGAAPGPDARKGALLVDPGLVPG